MHPGKHASILAVMEALGEMQPWSAALLVPFVVQTGPDGTMCLLTRQLLAMGSDTGRWEWPTGEYVGPTMLASLPAVMPSSALAIRPNVSPPQDHRAVAYDLIACGCSYRVDVL